jgi:hypothetical protein
MRISYILSIILVLSTIISCTLNQGAFEVVNNSKNSISKATVKICKQTIEFNSLSPMENVKGIYEVKGDSHFDITIEFSNGKIFQKEIGYVTGGFDYAHKIIISIC